MKVKLKPPGSSRKTGDVDKSQTKQKPTLAVIKPKNKSPTMKPEKQQSSKKSRATEVAGTSATKKVGKGTNTTAPVRKITSKIVKRDKPRGGLTASSSVRDNQVKTPSGGGKTTGKLSRGKVAGAPVTCVPAALTQKPRVVDTDVQQKSVRRKLETGKSKSEIRKSKSVVVSKSKTVGSGRKGSVRSTMVKGGKQRLSGAVKTALKTKQGSGKTVGPVKKKKAVLKDSVEAQKLRDEEIMRIVMSQPTRRVASLNASAVMQCMMENEFGKPSNIGNNSLSRSESLPQSSISVNSEPSPDKKSKLEDTNSKKTPAKKVAGTKKSPNKATALLKKKKSKEKLQKKASQQQLMELLPRRRMASLNAAAIMSACYAQEPRRVREENRLAVVPVSSTSSSPLHRPRSRRRGHRTSTATSVLTQEDKPGGDEVLTEDISHHLSSSSPPLLPHIIKQQLNAVEALGDVTITGVHYVATCSASTCVTNVHSYHISAKPRSQHPQLSTAAPPMQHPQQQHQRTYILAGDGYSPLGALTGMMSTRTLVESTGTPCPQPSRHSAFSPPQQPSQHPNSYYGYVQPAGPLIEPHNVGLLPPLHRPVAQHVPPETAPFPPPGYMYPPHYLPPGGYHPPPPPPPYFNPYYPYYHPSYPHNSPPHYPAAAVTDGQPALPPPPPPYPPSSVYPSLVGSHHPPSVHLYPSSAPSYSYPAPMSPPSVAPGKPPVVALHPPSSVHVIPLSAPTSPPSAPLNPLSAPMNPPSAPMNLLNSPMNPPSAPINPPSAPINPTSAPINPPSAPINPPSAPINPPSAPINQPSAPMSPQLAGPVHVPPHQHFRSPAASGGGLVQRAPRLLPGCAAPPPPHLITSAHRHTSSESIQRTAVAMTSHHAPQSIASAVSGVARALAYSFPVRHKTTVTSASVIPMTVAASIVPDDETPVLCEIGQMKPRFRPLRPNDSTRASNSFPPPSIMNIPSSAIVRPAVTSRETPPQMALSSVSRDTHLSVTPMPRHTASLRRPPPTSSSLRTVFSAAAYNIPSPPPVQIVELKVAAPPFTSENGNSFSQLSREASAVSRQMKVRGEGSPVSIRNTVGEASRGAIRNTVGEASRLAFRRQVGEASPVAIRKPVGEASRGVIRNSFGEASRAAFRKPVDQTSRVAFRKSVGEASRSCFNNKFSEASPSGVRHTVREALPSGARKTVSEASPSVVRRPVSEASRSAANALLKLAAGVSLKRPASAGSPERARNKMVKLERPRTSEKDGIKKEKLTTEHSERLRRTSGDVRKISSPQNEAVTVKSESLSGNAMVRTAWAVKQLPEDRLSAAAAVGPPGVKRSSCWPQLSAARRRKRLVPGLTARTSLSPELPEDSQLVAVLSPTAPSADRQLPGGRRRRRSRQRRGSAGHVTAAATLPRPRGGYRWSHAWTVNGPGQNRRLLLKNNESLVDRLCYSCMQHVEGDVIRVNDCVLLKSAQKDELPFIGRVAAIFISPDDNELLVSLLWYYRPEQSSLHESSSSAATEVYASRHRDTSSVACIEDKCYVLTWNEYCRYCKFLAQCQCGVAGVGVGAAGVVPDPPDEYPRAPQLPPARVAPDRIFYCSRVFDYRTGRLLKNPL